MIPFLINNTLFAMVQGKINHKSSSRPGQSEPKCLTNSEVVQILRSLPGDRPFGVLEEGETSEFLRKLYIPLRSLFSTTTTTSQANRARIEQIDHLEVPSSLQSRFSSFETEPLQFWEKLVNPLPQYSDQLQENRARVFLQGAAQLDSNIEEQRILRRFVAVSAYNLFRRTFPTSSHTRVLEKQLDRFLFMTELPVSEHKICGDIIRRGQRHTQFCQKLEVGEEAGFGALFFASIPDTIWDDGGLHGEDFEQSIKHLQQKKIIEVSVKSNANRVANTLLRFHTNFVWTPRTCRGPPGNDKWKNARRQTRTQAQIYDSENLTTTNLASTNRSRQKRPFSLSETDNVSHLTIEGGQSRHREPGLVGIDFNFPVQLASETQITDLGEISTLAHPGENEKNANGCGSQFEQLVTATRSASSVESTQECPSAATSHESFGPQLGITDLDFFGPHLDMAYLNFLGPQLDMAELDCVDVQPSIDSPESGARGSSHTSNCRSANETLP